MKSTSLKISLEGIMFQPSSKFAQELIEAIRELKAYPKELVKKDITDFNKAYYATIDFFETTTSKKLGDSIFKYTGINVEKFYCREMFNTPYAAGLFFINASYPSDKKFNPKTAEWFKSAIDVVSGGGTKDKFVTPKTTEEFEKLLNNFDDNIGRFKVSDDLKGIINVRVGFDLGAVCFTDKIIHEKLLPLSAEETAAILLHEIGHIVGTVSYLKYCYYSYSLLINAFDHFSNYSSNEEKVKFFKSDKILKNPIIEEMMKDNPAYVQIKKFAEKCDIESKGSSKIFAFAIILGQLFYMNLNIINDLMIAPIYLLMKYANYYSEASTFNKSSKTSDFKLFNIQRYEGERIADEYVTKHNMGSYLQTALTNLNQLGMYNAGTFGFAGMGYSNKGAGIFYMTNLLGAINNFLPSVFSKSLTVHPPTKERLELITMTQIKNLKNSMNSPFALKLALDEYEKCHKNLLDNSIMQAYDATIKKIANIIENIVGILTFGLISVEQQNQLNALMHQALKLMDNDIFASVAKLKLMLKK